MHDDFCSRAGAVIERHLSRSFPLNDRVSLNDFHFGDTRVADDPVSREVFVTARIQKLKRLLLPDGDQGLRGLNDRLRYRCCLPRSPRRIRVEKRNAKRRHDGAENLVCAKGFHILPASPQYSTKPTSNGPRGATV